MHLQPKYQVCFLFHEGTIPVCETSPLEWSGPGDPGPELVTAIPPGAYGFYLMRIYETVVMTDDGEKVMQCIEDVKTAEDGTCTEDAKTIEYIIGCAYTLAQLVALDSSTSHQILRFFGDSIQQYDAEEVVAIHTSTGTWIPFEDTYVVRSPFDLMVEL